MTKLEFCTAVLKQFNGNWPYAGALSDAAKLYPEKTVEQAAAKLRATAASKRKRTR